MAINASKYTRTISCRYCDGDGHSVQHCPQIPIDGAKALAKLEQGHVLNYIENFALQRWQKNQEIAQARRQRVQSQKPKKCGYCKTTGHSRRTCEILRDDKKFLHEANKVWRRFWAEAAISKGFAPASLVKITVDGWLKQRFNLPSRDIICLIGSEQPKNLTVFAMARDYDQRQEITIPTNPAQALTLPASYLASVNPRNFIESRYGWREYLSCGYGWNSIEGVQVLSPSTYTYSEEWINECPPDIDYALKKWPRAKLQNFISKVKDFLDWRKTVPNIGMLPCY